MRIKLDCAQMIDRKQTHDYLKSQFDFPDYYGRNLDALYDLLSTSETSWEIVLINQDIIEKNLGGYGSALLGTIREAAEDNPKVTLIPCL